jgi:lipopolysaccharide transport protein LptA
MDTSHPDSLSGFFNGSLRPRRSAGRAPLRWAAAVMACLVASSAVAQSGLPPGNAEKPIDLQAASSDFDYKNNSLLFKRVKITQGDLQVLAQQASATGLDFDNSEWRLEGDVQIIVPGGKLESSEARVLFRNNDIVLASIKGSPAMFEQRLKEKDQVARGRAGSIDYDVKASTVRLTGAAWLSDGKNEIRGNTLIYDIGRERVQANPNEKDPGGVHITIKPKPKPGSPGTGPTATPSAAAKPAAPSPAATTDKGPDA